MNRLLESLKIPNLPIDIDELKKKSLILVSKLIRTKNIDDDFHAQKLQKSSSSKQKLTKCLTTLDLTSLGVGSCAGTGMYLVAGMVARNVAGPGVIFSFIIAALASIFSGACYAEFGVRVPHTTGSAYMYSYVTVGEFLAFVIGWNMILEYLIGTSACACALSACFDAISNGGVSGFSERNLGSIFGRPPDLLAFVIALLMMILLVAGVKKSLIFNNILNAINFSIWVFVMTAGLFYVDFDNWTKHGGFLPYGWSGVLTGAATCFYAFIGFDIIATTGEEATNPKKSIPLAIVGSLAIILIAYVTSSLMLTLIVPYNEIDEDSALVEMFGQVNATYCKYIVVIGALAGLTVSMFGSMFPMPRIIYAMAQDGLIFKLLAEVWPTTGTPALATLISGFAAAVAALFIKLEILVEMMSIGTLLAYTLVSTCVLILRYQPRTTNLVELLPQSLRAHLLASGADGGDPLSTPLPQDVLKQFLDANLPPIPPPTSPLPQQTNTQRVMIRRITRSSPDSDDTYSDDNDAFTQRDDQVLVSERTENKSYGTVEDKPSFTSSGIIGSTIGPSLSYLNRRFNEAKYLCPGIFPWTDHGPPTEESGMFVMKMVGYLYVLVIIFDIIVVCEMHYMGATAITFLCIFLFAILCILLAISRKPQNRHNMLFITPGLPFVPALAITINIYLILKLSILTLVRFTIWMTLGFIMYFYYGIKNSLLEDPNAQKVEENHTEKSTTVSEPADNALSSQYKSTKSNPFIKNSPRTEEAPPQDTWTGSVFKDDQVQSEKNGVNPLFVPETHFPSWDD